MARYRKASRNRNDTNRKVKHNFQICILVKHNESNEMNELPIL